MIELAELLICHLSIPGCITHREQMDSSNDIDIITVIYGNVFMWWLVISHRGFKLTLFETEKNNW